MKKITVTGGKGGTGKSTVATALAFKLGKNHRVLLVDADADCPNDHLLLGIKRNETETVRQRIIKINKEKCAGCGKCASVCEYNAIAIISKKAVALEKMCSGCGACKIVCPNDAISWKTKEVGKVYHGKGKGISLLSGELKLSEPVSELVVEKLNELISKKEKEFDYVIVDTAAGTHCDVISALRGADYAIAVTEPTPLGAHDLELILRLTSILGIEKGVVLNRAGLGKNELIEEICSSKKTSIIARIPYSKKIMESYSNEIPVEHESINEIVRLVK